MKQKDWDQLLPVVCLDHWVHWCIKWNWIARIAWSGLTHWCKVKWISCLRTVSTSVTPIWRLETSRVHSPDSFMYQVIFMYQPDKVWIPKHDDIEVHARLKLCSTFTKIFQRLDLLQVLGSTSANYYSILEIWIHHKGWHINQHKILCHIVWRHSTIRCNTRDRVRPH